MININVFSEEKAWSKRLKNKDIFFKKICKAFPKKYKFLNKKVTFTLLLSNNKNIKNLNKVFPKKSILYKKKIIKKMWFHFGRVIGEYPHLSSIKVFNNKHFEIKNLKFLIQSIESGQNCIFFSAHIGNWELTSHPLTELGYKISFIYRSPNNTKVDDMLRKIRLNYGVDLIRKGSVGAKECIKKLKEEKGNIGMLIDQKMNDGIETIFFGHKTMTASAIAKFSLKYKCPIIPSVCRRKSDINFVIKYLPEISYQKVKKLGTETKVMNLLNNYVESWIRESPEQWIWIHNRW